MTISVDGKIILVTGAAGGIGRSVCKSLRDAGAIVYASDISNAGEDIQADDYFKHDVSQASDWQHVRVQVERKHDRLDGLVNAAAISIVESVEGTALEEWRRVQSTNVESILIGTQTMLPLLKVSGSANKTGASIVNFSSVGGVRGAAFNSAYCASKASVSLFSKSCAHEFATLGYNIRVNTVHPGGVDTPMMQNIMQKYVEYGAAPDYEQAKAGVAARHPLGRLAQSDEIGGSIVYLCSDSASFVTGSELMVDGGYSAI